MYSLLRSLDLACAATSYKPRVLKLANMTKLHELRLQLVDTMLGGCGTERLVSLPRTATMH